VGEREIRALEQGSAFVDLSAWRRVLVTGADAPAWLNDLVTNRVDDLAPGEARRSLLLSRTGHVRADVHVGRVKKGLMLLQDPVQPNPIHRLLAPYVLSSDVSMEDRSGVLALFAVPLEAAPKDLLRPFPFQALAGALVPEDRRSETAESLRASGLVEATEGDLEAWRVRRGHPRFGVDFGQDSLPAEAGLDAVVDATKGCFLGQEAVAKVRNLGHPPWVVLALRSDADVQPGQRVMAGNEQAGHVTSVDPAGSEWALLARIRWDHVESGLQTAAGYLRRVVPPEGTELERS
jgi:folate-binding protein YgfZ